MVPGQGQTDWGTADLDEVRARLEQLIAQRTDRRLDEVGRGELQRLLRLEKELLSVRRSGRSRGGSGVAERQ